MGRQQPPEGQRLPLPALNAAAGATTWPDFKVDDRVRVFFSVQDPIYGVITVAPDRNGWVKVKEEGGLGAEFLALAAACVRLDDV